MELIFENENLKIYDTKKDYDFRYVIENKKNIKICVYLNGLDDYIEIDKNNWVGLFNGDYSDDIVKCLQENNGDYTFISEI